MGQSGPLASAFPASSGLFPTQLLVQGGLETLLYDSNCNHAAVGGGGTECGSTNVCCSITRPMTIPPQADGHCVAQLA